MLFKQNHLEGIKAGDISLAFRKWKKPAVKTGSLIKTSVGLIKIKDISEINTSEITENNALQAGFLSLNELLKLLNSVTEGIIHKIHVGYYDEDPRIALRENIQLAKDDWQEIKNKLARLDQYSKQGNWTLEILTLIHQNPLLRAADIAKKTKWEKEWLKLNVRKLKNSGLTISHDVGYSISPLGEKYLEWLSQSDL